MDGWMDEIKEGIKAYLVRPLGDVVGRFRGRDTADTARGYERAGRFYDVCGVSTNACGVRRRGPVSRTRIIIRESGQ